MTDQEHIIARLLKLEQENVNLAKQNAALAARLERHAEVALKQAEELRILANRQDSLTDRMVTAMSLVVEGDLALGERLDELTVEVNNAIVARGLLKTIAEQQADRLDALAERVAALELLLDKEIPPNG